MKKIVILVLFFILGITINSFAETLKEHTLEFGPEVYYFEYKEPGVMREKGAMLGADGSYSYHKNFMLKAEARFAYGQVDYKNSGTIDNIDDYTTELRGLGGYDFPIFHATYLTPYIGIGYRYLNDDLSGKVSSTGAVGYERESNYLYSPMGFETNTEFGNGWAVGLIAEYDYFWKGVQKSHLSDVDPGFNDVESDQNKGYGARGSVRIIKKGQELDLVFEPFVRYWNIKKSEEDVLTYAGTIFGFGYEPKNHTTEIGIKVALKF